MQNSCQINEMCVSTSDNDTSQVLCKVCAVCPDPLVLEFYLGVTRCPNGAARGCSDLNQRGHDDWPEITCWPKHHHYRLTTGREYSGLGLPDPVKLTETEEMMCTILGLNHLELGIFLRQWKPITTTQDRRYVGKGEYQSYYGHQRPTSLDDLMDAYVKAGQ